MDVRGWFGCSELLDEMREEALDWIPCVVSLKGLRVLIIFAYFQHTIGFVGRNAVNLTQISTLLRMMGLPFLIFAVLPFGVLALFDLAF